MSFIDDFKTDVTLLKSGIAELHTRSKEQVSSFIQKSNSTYTELLNILKRDESLEDTFVDGSKISRVDQLVYDKDGWTNGFFINEVPFLDDYKTLQTYPMTMQGGRIIPGSNFKDIFLDREGFWGYMKDDTPSTAEFTLTFKLEPSQASAQVNRVYLRTNNEVDVEAFYREGFGSQWVSLGKRVGRHHLWTYGFEGVELRFVASNTTMFPVSFVAAGLAKFLSSGKLISTYYTVENLRNLTIDVDADIPTNTAIRKFIDISNQERTTIPVSGWIPWEEEDIVPLGTNQVTIPAESGYLVPSGFIDESLVIRTGYQSWDSVSTTDYSLVTESVQRLGTDYLNIPANYKVIQNGLQALFIGEGDSRTEFEKDNDYIVQYDTDLNTVLVTDVPAGRLDGMTIEPTAEILLRKPVSVLQRRTFVQLDNDKDIEITIPTAGITLRTLHIGDTIEDETTIQNVGVGVYTISGRAGLNLIEVEGHNPSNPPELVGNYYRYFSNRYWLRRSEKMPPESNEYYLDPATSGYRVVTSSSDLYIRYLTPTEYNKVSVRLELEGTENVAPLLRGYKLTNRIDKA